MCCGSATLAPRSPLATAFEAEPLEPPLLRGDGTLFHAVIKLGDTTIMFADPRDPTQTRTAHLHLYVPDCDAAYDAALSAGARSVAPPADQFYGDRIGGVTDMAGNAWWIATHQRTLSRAEIERLAHDAESLG